MWTTSSRPTCGRSRRRAGWGGRAVNVGSGQSASLKQVLQTLGQIVGHGIEAERLPARPGDIRHSRADVAAAAGLLQFTPSVSLRDGLARTLQWYQTEGSVTEENVTASPS